LEGFFRFASEPVVVDLTDDGTAEVIFTSWTQKGSHEWGKLHVLDWLGRVIAEVELPAPRTEHDWNGALSALTLANVDSDADLEVVLMISHSGEAVTTCLTLKMPALYGAQAAETTIGPEDHSLKVG